MKRSHRILFIGAMDREIEGLLRSVGAEDAPVLLGCYPRWTAAYGADDAVMIVQTHVGDVNAAIATTAAIADFQPTMVLKIGCVGGHSAGIHTGDVVAPAQIFHSGAWIARDADATRWQAVFGDLPYQVNQANLGGRAAVLRADEPLTSAWERHLMAHGVRTVRAHIGSSNMWFFDPAHMTHVLDANLPDDHLREWAADMETYAAAQACAVAGVPFSGMYRAANSEYHREPYAPSAVAALFDDEFGALAAAFTQAIMRS